MKNRVLILLFAMVFVLAGCGRVQSTGSPSPLAQAAPTTALAPTAAATSIWKLVPVGGELSAPLDGKQLHRIFFAVQNTSTDNQPYVFNPGAVMAEAKEGYMYRSDPLRFEHQPFTNLQIPPGFYIAGTMERDLTSDRLYLDFTAAEKAHMIRLNFSDYGPVDISDIQPPKLLPTERPKKEFIDLPYTTEISQEIKITLSKPHAGEWGIYKGIAIDVRLQNKNEGYPRKVKTSCYMIDAKALARFNGAATIFEAGPGQTVDSKMGFYLGDNLTDLATVQALQKNAKLFCTGDLHGIFNLD